MSSTLAMILAAGGVGAALLTLALRGSFGGDGDTASDGAGPEDSSGSAESSSDGGGGGGDGGGD